MAKERKMNSNNLMEELFSSSPMSDWNNMQIFNSEQNYKRFTTENERLQRKFNGDFVKMNYDVKEKMLFLCELCDCILKNEKCLEVHCEGKSHLKKKEELLLRKKEERKFQSDDKKDCPPETIRICDQPERCSYDSSVGKLHSQQEKQIDFNGGSPAESSLHGHGNIIKNVREYLENLDCIQDEEDEKFALDILLKFNRNLQSYYTEESDPKDERIVNQLYGLELSYLKLKSDIICKNNIQ